MKKILTTIMLFSIVTTPIASVVSCNDNVEKPDLGNFYYMNIKEFSSNNAEEKFEEVFKMYAATREAEINTGEDISIDSAVMHLWILYGLILNDHFRDSINIEDLTIKHKTQKSWDYFIKDINSYDNFNSWYIRVLELYQTDEENYAQKTVKYANQIKKDYDAVFK